MGAPIGCAFRDRCPIAEEKCVEAPSIVAVTETRSVRCWVAQRESLARSAATRGQASPPEPWRRLRRPGARAGRVERSPSAAAPVATRRAPAGRSRRQEAFRRGRGLGRKTHTKVFAVDGVTFDLNRGETFGLVGESGCGKSTLARVLAGLYAPTAGTILLRGEDVHAAGARRRLRGELQMVFQNPASSLDPRRRIADSVAEPLIGSSGSKSRAQPHWRCWSASAWSPSCRIGSRISSRAGSSNAPASPERSSRIRRSSSSTRRSALWTSPCRPR